MAIRSHADNVKTATEIKNGKSVSSDDREAMQREADQMGPGGSELRRILGK